MKALAENGTFLENYIKHEKTRKEDKEGYYGVCNRNIIIGFVLWACGIRGTWRKPDAWNFCNGYHLNGFAYGWQHACYKS